MERNHFLDESSRSCKGGFRVWRRVRRGSQVSISKCPRHDKNDNNGAKFGGRYSFVHHASLVVSMYCGIFFCALFALPAWRCWGEESARAQQRLEFGAPSAKVLKVM